MKYKNQNYRACEAYARNCATRLADLAGWTFASRPELLPPVLCDYLYEPSAQLILIPWGGGRLTGLEAAVRETRCLALMVEPGFTNEGWATVYFTLVRSRGGKIEQHSALRLWVNAAGALFLVPDRDGPDPDGDCFAVDRRGIEPATAPWTGEHARGFGLGNADALMLAPKAEERR